MADHFNCSEWLVDRQVAAGHGARTALRSGDALITYEELLDFVVRALGGLRGLGVRPEERVLMILRDGPELAIAILRCDAYRRRRPPGQSVAAAARPRGDRPRRARPVRDRLCRCRDGAMIAALTADAPDLDRAGARRPERRQ